MKKLLFTIVSLFLVSIIIAQNVTYTSSSENFANPERGWYKYSKAESTTSFSFLSQSSLTNMRVNDKITLILRIYDLGAFKTVPISQTFLDNIKTDFNSYMQEMDDKDIEKYTHRIGKLTKILSEPASS